MESKQNKEPERETHIDGYEIDEDASRCSNGIKTTLNEEGLDVRIDLHDFDFEYEVLNHMLILYGKRKQDVKESLVNKGRYYQAFVRPISLPRNMDTEKIHKEVKDGIMHIKVPKSGVAKKLRDIEHCALCKFRNCLHKFIPGFAEFISTEK